MADAWRVVRVALVPLGVRFGRVGIWLPNAVAAVLQVVLGAVVLTK